MPISKTNWTFISEDSQTTKTWDELLSLQQAEELTIKKMQGRPLQKFGACEHQAIGDEAFVRFSNSLDGGKILFELLTVDCYQRSKEVREQMSVPTLQLKDGVWLSPGDIIALAGDFYGKPHQPICEGQDGHEQQTRFRAAYAVLAEGNSEEISDILALVKEEAFVVKAAKKLSMRPNIALDYKANRENHRFAQITRYFPLIPSLLYSRYSDLALNNLDHFGADAKIAYQAGHTEALKTAKLANDAYHKNDSNQCAKFLTEALIQELFACHFLTDLFASGHIRTPRRELKKLSSSALIAGILAKAMHDEDGKEGLYVRDQNPEKQKHWFAKGDNCLFNEESAGNHEESIQAVVSVLQEVYQVFCEPPENIDEFVETKSCFHAVIPKPDEQKVNFPGLFRIQLEDNTVERRKELTSTGCQDYYTQKEWSPVGTACQLFKSQFFPATSLTETDKKALEEEIELLEKLEKETTAETGEDTDHSSKISCRVM